MLVGQSREILAMETFLVALGSSFLGGILSPLVLAWLQHRLIWRTQKTAEARKTVFDEAVNAIGMFEADAQKQPVTFRQETTDRMQKALALVEACFSPEAFNALTQYTKRDLSKGPSAELNRLRTTAIKTMATELGLNFSG
jgi:hypothetical protein